MADKQKNKKNTAKVEKPLKEKWLEDMAVVPLSFVKALQKQIVYNPKNASATKSSTYSVYSKEDILSWLQNPSTESNQKNLRNASIYMSLASMHYNRLLHSYAGLYIGNYVMTPLNFDSEVDLASFSKQYKKAQNSIEAMYIPHLLRLVTLVALREGVFYGILRKDSQTAIIQKIDPDYCRITSICDGSYLYSVDMTKLNNKLEFYPSEFTMMYNNYLLTGEKWQEVPLDICVCIKADNSISEFSVPPFAAVMPSLYTIANTELLNETASELRNYKMLSGVIPTNEKGRPLIDDKMIAKYYNHISNALGDNIGLALTPFKLESHSFENKSGTKEIDDMAQAVSNFWSTAGTSGLLHGRENNTGSVTKLSIVNDETFVIGIVQQLERSINRYLKTAFSGKIKFKISILPITVFNKGEYLEYYKTAASFGIGKSYYAAALGITQSDMSGLQYIEKNLMPFDELVPLKSSYTTSNDGGRPAKSAGDLTPSGEVTKDNDANANR